MENKKYIVYTDGSCNNLSPYGEGGAAYVVLDGEGRFVRESSTGSIYTTNNRMEMLAIVSAVASLPEGSEVVVRSDSKYSLRTLGEYPYIRNWRIDPNEPFDAHNNDMVRAMAVACKGKTVRLEWVKGHNDNRWNERCDELAGIQYQRVKEKYNIPTYSRKNSPKVFDCENPLPIPGDFVADKDDIADGENLRLF